MHNNFEQNKVVCRRKSDPQIVLRAWSAITCASRDNRLSDVEVLLEYANKDPQQVYSLEVSPSYFKDQLNYAVDDGLLVESQGLYSIPSVEEAAFDGHDWYCFHCHVSGNVVFCKSCWRVYHPMCVLKHLKRITHFSCSMCQSLQEKQKPVFPQLLAFVLLRLKVKTSPLYNLRNHSNPIPQALPLLLCRIVDLDTIQTRVINNYYSSALQFEQDVCSLYHNVAVAYGASSDYAGLAKLLLKDCRYELEELLLCNDCYFFSNFRPKNWFCYPCTTPHQLVYAKLKGFPYWPAKIIKATPQGYNVRFFGARHQRALVPESFIQSIETDRKRLYQRKVNASLVKSLEELDLHLKMIEEGASIQMDMEASQIFETFKKQLKRKRANSSCQVLISENEKSDLSSLYLSESESDGRRNSSPEKIVRKSSPTKQRKVQPSSECCSTKNGHCTSEEPCKIMPASKKGSDRETIQLRMLSEYANYLKQSSNPLKQPLEEFQASWCKKFMLKRSDAFLRTILDVETALRQREAQAAEALRAMEKCFRAEISKNKKRQWCFNCERPAQYYCCWNTSYCSHNCQREHWQKEHRNTCRRVHRTQGNALDNGHQ